MDMTDQVDLMEEHWLKPIQETEAVVPSSNIHKFSDTENLSDEKVGLVEDSYRVGMFLSLWREGADANTHNLKQSGRLPSESFYWMSDDRIEKIRSVLSLYNRPVHQRELYERHSDELPIGEVRENIVSQDVLVSNLETVLNWSDVAVKNKLNGDIYWELAE
jgi:hypothetical protein